MLLYRYSLKKNIESVAKRLKIAKEPYLINFGIHLPRNYIWNKRRLPRISYHDPSTILVQEERNERHTSLNAFLELNGARFDSHGVLNRSPEQMTNTLCTPVFICSKYVSTCFQKVYCLRRNFKIH